MVSQSDIASTAVVLRFGFEVKWQDLDTQLRARIEHRLNGSELQNLGKKLLTHMLLDMETIKLASESQLSSEAELTDKEIKAVLSEDRQWQSYNDSITAQYLQSQSQSSKPSFSFGGGPQASAKPADPPQPVVKPAETKTTFGTTSFGFASTTAGAGAAAPAAPSFSFGQNQANTPPVVNPTPPTYTPQPPPQPAVSQPPPQAARLPSDPKPDPTPPPAAQPSIDPPKPTPRPDETSAPGGNAARPEDNTNNAAAAKPDENTNKAEAAKQPEPERAPSPEQPDPSEEVPNASDVPFQELVEYVMKKVHNPNNEDAESEAAGLVAIRAEKFELAIAGTDMRDFTLGDFRAAKAKFEEIADKFDEDELKLIRDNLFNVEVKAAPVVVKAAPKRPRANHNFHYGGITTLSKGIEGVDTNQIIRSWDELDGLKAERERAFGDRGGDLLPMERIIHAINEYGQQSQWNRDEDGKNFVVRPIQGATLPHSLRGHNLVATAETGSGKTMCFAVVAIAAVQPSRHVPQVLIMAHNRPLLDQLCDEMDKLCTSLNNEIRCSFVDRDDRGDPTAQIILSTAGQLGQRVRRGHIPVRDVKLVIADEVDDIFGQNREQNNNELIHSLIQNIERTRQRPQILFFSATIGDDDKDPDDRALRGNIEACLGRKHIVTKAERKDVAGMTHVFMVCDGDRSKFDMLCWLLSDLVLVGSAMVFCKRKERDLLSVKELILKDNDCRRRLGQGEIDGEVGVQLLTGVQEFTAGQDVTREDRLKMMNRFRENKARILIATDAVAKGIDVPNVTMVVHVELCKDQRERDGFTWIKTRNKALDQYRHRAGRTARALQKGVSITLITPQEEPLAREYMNVLKVGGDNLRFVRAQEKDSVKKFLSDAQC